MIYTIIISLLTEKLFHLLRPQSFSFEILSEFIDTFVKFSNFMPQGWGVFVHNECPEGRPFVVNDCPRGTVFAPFKSCPGRGMVLDEIDTCIIFHTLRF